MQTDILLADGVLRVSLSPQGAALTGASWAGRAFLSTEGPGGAASFPMVPLCNRVAGNSFVFGGQRHRLRANTADPLYLHGDGWLTLWQVDESGAARARLSFRQSSGPFRYRAVQEVALEDQSLHLRLSVRNEGAEPMPFGLGFHPYFPREGATLSFAAAARWSEGPNHLPLRREPVPADLDFALPRPLPETWQNNAYDGWDGKVAIRWPGLALDLTADPAFGALMLYAPAAANDPGRPGSGFFCVEPMSHLPDALNAPGRPGLRTLAPGEELAAAIRMTPRPDAAEEGR